MKDTAFFVQAQKASRFTSLYKWSETDAMQLAETAKKSKFLFKPAFLSGGGGLVSTTDDFMKLCLMLLNKGKLENTKLLSKESVELITKNHLKTGLHPFGNQSFGFGFNVQVLIDPSVKKVPGTIGTYDWGGSAGTRFIIDPENNLVGIFMTQLSGYRSLKLDEKFRKVMYEIKGEKK
jgi:CubicO group peptidase (beta-lactamase class C family)